MDIEVAGVHSFTGNGVLLHNSQIEGMACGIPQIIPDFAALGEWPGDAAVKIQCSNFSATAGNLNTIGAIPDREPFIDAMQEFYLSESLRKQYGQLALDRARLPMFNWKDIAAEFNDVLNLVLDSDKEEQYGEERTSNQES